MYKGEHQQSEVDRQRLLDGLENQLLAREDMPARRKGLIALLATGTVLLAFGALAVMTFDGEDDKQIVLAGTAPLPPQRAVEATREPVMHAAVEAPPSTGDNTEPDAETNAEPNAKADAEAKPDLDIDRATAEQAPAHIERAPEARPVSNIRKKRVASKASVPMKKLAIKQVAAVDNDVALLTALVTHAKASQPRQSASGQLRQCKALANKRDIKRCLKRVCTALGAAPECKNAIPVKHAMPR